MLVRFLCPACHQLLGTAPRKVGAQVNCPKCGATILVPDPEEAAVAEPLPAIDEPTPASNSTKDTALAGFDEAPEMPAGAIGFDVLGDVTTYERPRGGASPSVLRKASPQPVESPDKDAGIVVSRRVIYFQAILLALVGLLALAAGYLIGSGARLHGP